MWQSLSVTCDRSVVFSGSSTNKIDRHDITEILLTVALNAIKQNKQSTLLRQGGRLPRKSVELACMVTFEQKYNCQYHLSSSERKWQKTFQQGIDIFRKTFWIVHMLIIRVDFYDV
jgi:hypothetical protein